VLLLPVDRREDGQVDGAPCDRQPHPRGEERETGKHDADVLDPELPQLVTKQPQLCGHETIRRQLSGTPVRIIVRRGCEQRLASLIDAVFFAIHRAQSKAASALLANRGGKRSRPGSVPDAAIDVAMAAPDTARNATAGSRLPMQRWLFDVKTIFGGNGLSISARGRWANGTAEWGYSSRGRAFGKYVFESW
jgi:hypothetical protein